jgi:hypothetical protein
LNTNERPTPALICVDLVGRRQSDRQGFLRDERILDFATHRHSPV